MPQIHSPTRAVAYLRVSTAEQAETRNGLDAQRAAILTFAARAGFAVTDTLIDAGISGAAPISERTGLTTAINTLRRGDVLIVAKLDRLSRAGELETAIVDELIARRGARILSAAGEGTDDASPTGQLLRDIVKAFSRHERALIASRTSAALQAKKARGERVGALPYGQNDEERRALAIIDDCHTAGYSLPDTARELNAQGCKTRSGTPWRWEYVRSVLNTRAGASRNTRGGKQARATRAAIEAITKK
jgi:DNA invertase Pin-like site-specific DNA recombinase